MARAKRHYIPGYVWHTPVKQKKKRFNGVTNPYRINGWKVQLKPTIEIKITNGRKALLSVVKNLLKRSKQIWALGQ